MAEVTVVFADFTGSTGVFESLGNAKATQAITRLTHWVGGVCEQHFGRVVKYLGDGVLMVFNENTDSIDTVVELQRIHRERIANWPDKLMMRLKVGMARGEVVEVSGDCFGDAVNIASRLSDLSGPDQILATDTVVQQMAADSLVRFRSMGAMEIRGRSEARIVHRVEWQPDVLSEFFTVPASLTPASTATPAMSTGIGLTWLDIDEVFSVANMPIYLGRDREAHFVVQDPRVSRKHARLEWRGGKFHLVDVSTYGTWVKFTVSGAMLGLRRQSCVLLGEGEIALGASFEDFTVPTVSFRFEGGRPVVRAR